MPFVSKELRLRGDGCLNLRDEGTPPQRRLVLWPDETSTSPIREQRLCTVGGGFFVPRKQLPKKVSSRTLSICNEMLCANRRCAKDLSTKDSSTKDLSAKKLKSKILRA